MSKLARILVSPEFLIELCKAGPPRMAKVVKHALPDDATFVDAEIDGPRRAVLITVASEAFDMVNGDDPIPELPATEFERVYAEEVQP